jgi:predicted RNA-binding Zn ribbon-like protein
MGDVQRMELIGGHVALDFVNTLGGLPDRADDEYLFEYLDLLKWLARVGLQPPDRHRDIRQAAEEASVEATRVFEDVRRLRGSVDHLLRCRLSAETADDGHLEVVRSAYAEAAEHATLEEHAGSYRLSWSTTGTRPLRWPLWVIAAACLDLLTGAPFELLRRCEHCRWMFVDHSRNHTRRWCSMNSCGAIIKMRRHRAARRFPPR